MTTFCKELRAANIKRAPDFRAGSLNDWTLAERGHELADEVGELCHVLKKMLRLSETASAGGYQCTHDEAFKELQAAAIEELGDVIIAADLIAAQMHVDLEAVVRDKFNKTSAKIGSTVKL